MFNALFPASTNNAYRGNRLALVMLALLAALKLLIGVRSALDPAAVAQGADGIPIDKFPPAAANEVLNMFGLLGINNVIIAALCFIVLWRYRALVPLMFGVQLAGRGMHWFVMNWHPGAPTNPNAPGDIVGWVVFALTLGGFVLSLWIRKPAES